MSLIEAEPEMSVTGGIYIKLTSINSRTSKFKLTTLCMNVMGWTALKWYSTADLKK